MCNEFVEKTKEVLDCNNSYYDESRIAPRGFEIADGKKKEKCILIIGLNPAGDAEDADREKEDRTYFYSMGNEVKTKWQYNKYYGPIFDFAKKTVEGGVKWPWCNMEWKDLEKK